MSGPYVVAFDGAAVPAGHYSLFTLTSQPTTTANIQTNFIDVANVLGRPLLDSESDWLDVLAAVYAADLLCTRGQNEAYTRDIQISMRVRNPVQVRGYLPEIEEMFERLCQDRLRIVVESWHDTPRARFPTRQD